MSRGLGTIRQDVNVSIRNGLVVEVKGVQQLEQLEKTIEYEAARQDGLYKIANKLLESKCTPVKENATDVTKQMSNCSSKIVQKMLQDGDRIIAIKFPKYAGIFGYSPYEGIRLGSEIAQRVKTYGLGGIFHSDELPNYGIEQKDIDVVLSSIDADASDGFILVSSPILKKDVIVSQIVKRVNMAFDGVVAETRLSMQDGKTVFLRPRPGSSRMYPETDIAPIIITDLDIQKAKDCIPKPWDETLKEFGKKYDLNPQLEDLLVLRIHSAGHSRYSNHQFFLSHFNCNFLCNSPAISFHRLPCHAFFSWRFP